MDGKLSEDVKKSGKDDVCAHTEAKTHVHDSALNSSPSLKHEENHGHHNQSRKSRREAFAIQTCNKASKTYVRKVQIYKELLQIKQKKTDNSTGNGQTDSNITKEERPEIRKRVRGARFTNQHGKAD